MSPTERTHAKDKRGFTLIEIIATLVLVGVLSSIAVLFMGSFMNGYTTVKNNSSAALKAQMALNRVSLELKDMSLLSSLTGTSITYNNSQGNNRTIVFDGANINLSNYLLIDKISNFYLSATYDNVYNVALDDLAYIDIGFMASGVTPSFSTRIFPRNRIIHP